MGTDGIVLLAIAASILALIFSKTHIAFVTFGLCVGFVLAQYAGPDAIETVGEQVNASTFPVEETVRIVLLLLPALLVGYRFHGSQRGAMRLVEQVVTGVAFALLLVVFVIDILPAQTVESFMEGSYLAANVEAFSLWVVIFGISTALFDVMMKHVDSPRGGKRGPGRPPKR